MNRLAVITLIFFLTVPLFSERIQTPVGESFSRGSIQSVILDQSGYPVLLIRNWKGEGGLLRMDSRGENQTLHSFGKRNLVAVRLEGENLRLFEAPIILETWMMRKLDEGGLTVLNEIPVPEICLLAKEKGYPPEMVEGYYQVSPDGKFLLSEFRLPDNKMIRRRTDYYNRQVIITDLIEGKILFSRFFLTEMGFRDKASPRNFPLYSFYSNTANNRFVMAGPANKPAIYGELLRNPVYLDPYPGETRFHFIDSSLLFQWDHYSKRCRLFGLEEGKLLKEFRFGLRYPVLNSDGTLVVSLQDDGVWIYHRLADELILKGFQPFTVILIGCRFGLLTDRSLILFPSRFEEGYIEWEKMVLNGEFIHEG